MQRALPQLLALVGEIMTLIGLAGGFVPTTVARAVRIRALRLLRPAEACARRLIVLMAREIEVDVVTDTQPAQHSPHGERSRTTGGSRAPGFRLFEPIPSFGLTFVSEGDVPEARPAIPATQRAPSPSGLIARITALKTVLDDPHAHAGLHAIRLATCRRTPRERGGSGWGFHRRTNPLRPGWPPGCRSRHTPAWLTDHLRHFASEIRRMPTHPPPEIPPETEVAPPAPAAANGWAPL